MLYGLRDKPKGELMVFFVSALTFIISFTLFILTTAFYFRVVEFIQSECLLIAVISAFIFIEMLVYEDSKFVVLVSVWGWLVIAMLLRIAPWCPLEGTMFSFWGNLALIFLLGIFLLLWRYIERKKKSKSVVQNSETVAQ